MIFFVTILFTSLLGCIATILPSEGYTGDAPAHSGYNIITAVQFHAPCTLAHADTMLSDAAPCKIQETSLRPHGGRSHLHKTHSANSKGKAKFHTTCFTGIAGTLCGHPVHIPNSVEKYILALERLII